MQLIQIKLKYLPFYAKYFLLCNKKSRFDFADELKVGYVRYKHWTQITIKVQLFWRLPYEM